MEGGRKSRSSVLTELRGVSTLGTPHEVASIVQFHGKAIDTVFAVAVVARERLGIGVAFQTNGARKLIVQLTQSFSVRNRRSSHYTAITCS